MSQSVAPRPRQMPTPTPYELYGYGFPQSQSRVTEPDGSFTKQWLRYFQFLWLKTSAGTTSAAVNLGTVNQGVNQNTNEILHANQQISQALVSSGQALATIATVQQDVAAETNRAVAAEANLQNQINAINAQIADINTRLAQHGI